MDLCAALCICFRLKVCGTLDWSLECCFKKWRPIPYPCYNGKIECLWSITHPWGKLYACSISNMFWQKKLDLALMVRILRSETLMVKGSHKIKSWFSTVNHHLLREMKQQQKGFILRENNFVVSLFTRTLFICKQIWLRLEW